MATINKPNNFSSGNTISSSEVNSNFDTIYNEFNGSISAANLATDAVSTAKIADSAVTTDKINDAAVTVAKRSGGFKIGTIAAATLGTTGNKAISGVGFTPKLVEFTLTPADGSNVTVISSRGAMTTSNQFYNSIATNGTNTSRIKSTSGCIAFSSPGSTTRGLEAAYVSMDADGFTINVTTASTFSDVQYIAYG